MKVSLIVSTYNKPDYLLKVLESVLYQTVFPFEVIVADDGSTEETAITVKNFSKNAPFPVKHVWQEDLGFRAAKIRNEGIKVSEGDYIIFLDGDCIVNKHFIEDHIKLAEKGCFVQGKRILLDEEISKVFSYKEVNSFFKLILNLNHMKNIHHIFRLSFFPAIKNQNLKGIKSCNMGFWKEDLLSVNGFNEVFVGWGREDSEIAVRLFKYGLKKKVHPFMAVCFHLWHKENPRDRLNKNDEILKNTIESKGYICKDGIKKIK